MVRNKSRRLNKFSQKHLLVVALVCVAIIAGLIINSRYFSDHTPENQPATGGSGINLNPPTDQEKAEAEAHKNSIGQSSPSTTTSSGKKQVTPVITNADKQEVNAYVSGVFEEGGTCTATLTKDGKTVTKTSKGFGNVSYTSCEPIDLDGSLTAGSWTVIVSYISNTAEGQSQPKVFTVD